MLFAIVGQERTASILEAFKHLLPADAMLEFQLGDYRCRDKERLHIRTFVYTNLRQKLSQIKEFTIELRKIVYTLQQSPLSALNNLQAATYLGRKKTPDSAGVVAVAISITA
ncbi:hypothetical protein [Duganella hordei]|uniref:hypothetical protein n=1 Tax=Duganella hordei TaxID=2865934 RepID=UPI00333FD5D3